MVEDSGHLLHAGGWGDQPAWLVEAIEINKQEAALRKKERGSDGGQKT